MKLNVFTTFHSEGCLQLYDVLWLLSRWTLKMLLPEQKVQERECIGQAQNLHCCKAQWKKF